MVFDENKVTPENFYGQLWRALVLSQAVEGAIRYREAELKKNNVDGDENEA